MNKLSEKEQNLLQINNETLEIGKQISIRLNEDSEIFEKNKNKLNESNYHVKTANRIERGMTWSGWLYNIFSLPVYWVSSAYRQPKYKLLIKNIYCCPNCMVQLKSNEELVRHYNELHIEKNQRQIVLYNSKNTFLDELQYQLNELQEINVNINHLLNYHNNELNILTNKTDTIIYNIN